MYKLINELGFFFGCFFFFFFFRKKNNMTLNLNISKGEREN